MKKFNTALVTISPILTFALVSLGLLGGCTSTPKKATTAAEPKIDFPIIDAHMHTKFSGEPNQFSGILDTQENLLNEMAANGVQGGVVHTYKYDEGYTDLSAHNIVHCAGVEGRPNAKVLEAGLKAKKYRCMKVYLGYIFQFATHPAYEVVYKLAEKYNVPVVFHTGDTSDRVALVKYSHPMDIDEVAVKHPKVKFVLAHLGNPWVDTAAEVVYKNANVYADVSAFLIGDLAETDPAKIQEYVVKPIRWAFGYIEDPSKLMYGTDWPLTGMATYIEAVKKAIPPQHWRAVFRDNAIRVFGLDAKEPTDQKIILK